MKRVICLYRVSTIGQVDHDDIPMQKLACHEYAATHPDWEIVDEISEKGVSGYKVSTNARDAIVEIKKRAITHQFDVLLVFMFDRLGRRDDETPFVVQWFVQQGIEVWSTREGEQRFDTHVDKLLNYIRFWQASGESEKTAIRVRTKHSQMIQEGQWRGGLVPYGYRLEFQGRTNKKNKPVRDLMIDEEEGKVVKEIFHLLTEERDLYRCYRKISSRNTCTGQSTYDMHPINDAVEIQVRSFLSKLASKPREELLQMASARNTEMYKVALKQAEKEYENAQKQVTALEEEAVKALTGESALDLSVINTMIIKHRAKRDAAAQTIEEARARLEQEQMSQKETQAQIDEMLSWADCYDKANIETRHMIIARIIEKVEVRANRKIHIKFRISLDQFLGKSA